MNCVVIVGTEIKGCTYNLKNIFLEELNPTKTTEFYLPKDGPSYCIGCKRCFLESADKCPHYNKVEPIWRAMLEADLIVFAYPVYVLRCPGHVKSLLDHLGVYWFAHRPNPVMFNKTAAIITQSAGAPNGAAQKDVKTSLEWLGVSKVERIGFSVGGSDWDEISEDKKKRIDARIRTFAGKFQGELHQKKSLKSKLYFEMCRKLQRDVLKKLDGEKPNADLQYWIDNGWVRK